MRLPYGPRSFNLKSRIYDMASAGYNSKYIAGVLHLSHVTVRQIRSKNLMPKWREVKGHQKYAR